MGTDLRDVWATSLFPSGDVWVLFGPDGGILGEVTVPARWTPDAARSQVRRLPAPTHR